MSTNKAVRTLHNDLTRLKSAESKVSKAEAAEKTASADEQKALAAIQAQETQLIDSFVSAPPTDATQRAQLLNQLFNLGQSAVKTQDAGDAKIAADKKAITSDKKAVTADQKTALKDLKPAEYHLSLKDTNAARKQLGLKALTKPVRDSFKPGSFHKGPGTEYGADTSNWQSNAEFQASIKGKPFAAVKASDGTAANQADFKSRWNELGKLVDSGKMKLRIAYHYLEPNESGVAQAKTFLNTVGIHGKLKAGTRLALDWEGGALSQPSVLRDAANYIHKVTGVWPIVYSSAGNASAAHAAAPNSPQWLAAVADNAGDALPVSMRNRNVPFFQYSWKPWDEDQFNGNLKALEKFAGY
ncbi:MAG: hypothetical protein JST54_00650 [Deltaproteobacteria bacterium]|nr:hypothetical protein [Deltaproteobacteria bacterium]